MANTSLDQLLQDELKDIYSAETQLVNALPDLAQAAGAEDLRAAIEKHLEQTRIHIQRIEEISRDLKLTPGGKHCAGMEGLIKEAREVIQSGMESDAKQAALIGAAQRVEHYEIAAYGTARAHAKQLGYVKAYELLSQSLEEEREADKRLTHLAENQANVKAAMTAEHK
jgi:ferritin-like metal-binding protein YciE